MKAFVLGFPSLCSPPSHLTCTNQKTTLPSKSLIFRLINKQRYHLALFLPPCLNSHEWSSEIDCCSGEFSLGQIQLDLSQRSHYLLSNLCVFLLHSQYSFLWLGISSLPCVILTARTIYDQFLLHGYFSRDSEASQ